jgi:hypothetical protein
VVRSVSAALKAGYRGTSAGEDEEGAGKQGYSAGSAEVEDMRDSSSEGGAGDSEEEEEETGGAARAAGNGGGAAKMEELPPAASFTASFTAGPA